MKLICLVITVLLVFPACDNSKKSVTKGWELASATKQGWSGGMPGSGTGTNYSININGSGMEDVSFDTVWHNSRAFIPEVKVVGSNATLRFSYSRYPADRDDPMSKMDEDPPQLTSSPEFEGEALIIGRKGEKRFTLPVPRFEVLEYLNYP